MKIAIAALCLALLGALAAAAESELPLEYVVGDENPVLGAKVRPGVSESFARAETDELFHALESQRFRDLLRPYVCGDPLPELSFTVSLWRRAQWEGRHVEIQESPRIAARPENECLLAGFKWFAIRETEAIDRKAQARSRSTGQVESALEGCRGARQGPICDCSRRSEGVRAITWYGCEQ